MFKLNIIFFLFSSFFNEVIPGAAEAPPVNKPEIDSKLQTTYQPAEDNKTSSINWKTMLKKNNSWFNWCCHNWFSNRWLFLSTGDPVFSWIAAKGVFIVLIELIVLDSISDDSNATSQDISESINASSTKK